MTQFLVVSLSQGKETVQRSIEQNIAPSDRIEIAPNAWLVAFDGKAVDLRDKLFPVDREGKGSLLISSMTDVSGYGPNDMIQWMDEHDR